MISDVHSCHGKVQQLTHCHMEGPLPSLNLASRPNREIEPAWASALHGWANMNTDRTCPGLEKTPGNTIPSSKFLQWVSHVISQIFVPAAAPEAFKKDTQLPRNGATFFPKKSNKEVHHDTPWRQRYAGIPGYICSVIMTLKVTYVIIKHHETIQHPDADHHHHHHHHHQIRMLPPVCALGVFHPALRESNDNIKGPLFF